MTTLEIKSISPTRHSVTYNGVAIGYIVKLHGPGNVTVFSPRSYGLSGHEQISAEDLYATKELAVQAVEKRLSHVLC